MTASAVTTISQLSNFHQKLLRQLSTCDTFEAVTPEDGMGVRTLRRFGLVERAAGECMWCVTQAGRDLVTNASAKGGSR